MTNTNDLTRLAEQFKGRADDCGKLARAILADRERQAGEAVAEVCAGWDIRWVGSEPIAALLAKHPDVRIGTKLYTLASLPAPQAVPDDARMWEDDLYAFAGWLTTRPGVMPVGSTSDAAAMAEAVNEYINSHADRFVRLAAPSPDGNAEQAEAPSEPEELICPECSEGFVLGSRAWVACSTCRGSGRTDVVGDYEPGTNRKTDIQPTASNAGERELSIKKLMEIAGEVFDEDFEFTGPLVEFARGVERATIASKPKPKTADEMRPDFEWWWVTRAVFPALGTREAAAAWAAWIASGGYTAPGGWQLSDAPWGWEAVNSAPQPEQVAQDSRPTCMCGEPWVLNTVHRENTPCWRAADPVDGLDRAARARGDAT